MARTPERSHHVWPPIMEAATAAAYVDEKTVERFLRRVGKVYPRPRNISGRGRVWYRQDLDRAMGIASEAAAEDAASLL